MHLLIPFAACSEPQAQELMVGLLRDRKLPQLQRLLARLRPVQRDSGAVDSLSPPHERVLARLLGLQANDGLIPWAARQNQQDWPSDASAAWGWITPCHWQVGRDQMQMDPPDALDLQEDESRDLLAAMQAYFEEDGIHLIYVSPVSWLGRSALFKNLASASLDRVIGHDPADWLPRGPDAALLRRLQNEMQMLLYTHPVNERRVERGLTPVNSFWLSGSGALSTACPDADLTETISPLLPRSLANAALRQDWPAWAAAWQQLDAGPCQALWGALQQNGGPERCVLTLCGERNAQTYGATGNPWLARAQHFFTRSRLAQQLESL